MPRDLDLTFDISTGALTLDRVVGNYVKRSETLTLSVTIVSNGASATIPAGLVGTLKPVNTYGTTLAQWTTFAQVGATNVYTASTTINAAAVSTLLGTTTEQANCVLDFAGAGVVESDTLALVLKNNVTRDDDTAPTALLNRNDFLVSNGTGLLVNVAAGYAANGAFVAAQASLAITNATNYIEVTAAGVASVNTTAFTAGSYPLAKVVASAGAITSNTDLRAWITPKPATAGGVTSITGTANEITVTGTTTPTLSLPSALTFTGKTVTGGTFNSPTLFEPGSIIYKILDTQDGTRKGHLTNDFTHVYLDSGGDVFLRSTDFVSSYLTLAHFSASTGQMSLGMSAFLSGKIGFKNSTSTGTTILASANASANDYTTTLPAATGTLALVSGNLGTPSAIVLTNASGSPTGISLTMAQLNSIVSDGDPAYVGAANTFTTGQTISSTTSLLLGTAGSAVGNVGFRNATSGTTTLQPATGALGTGTVTLPLSGTLATLEGSNTYTGTTNTFTLPTTTGSTTTSGIAVAANSLTTGTGIYAASSTLTSGKLLDLQVSGTAAAASQTALNVATLGANGTSGITSKGAVISNTHTGTTSTNTALELTASGGTTNVALLATAGHVLVPDGSYVYNTSVSPSIGRSAVSANSTDQAGILLGSNSLTLLTNSIRGFLVSGYGAFGNSPLITGVGNPLTFATSVISTGIFQASEDKASTPNTGTLRGGGGSGTNIAGGILHIIGGASTGSAAGGSILIRTTPAGGSGSSANAAVTAITIDSTQAVTLAATLAVTGASTFTGNLTSNGALISTPQALSGAGAVNVTTLTTAVTTTAPAQALTLADGTNGQIKTIVHQALSGGGTWVLTPTTKTGYTTITSTAVGETCTLQFFTTIGWCILSLRGAIAA